MQIVPFTLTIGASPVRAATTYTPCCKILFRMATGGTGNGAVGNSTVTSAGVNGIQLAAASSTAPGEYIAFESQDNTNSLDVSVYYFHGAVPGDTVSGLYHVN